MPCGVELRIRASNTSSLKGRKTTRRNSTVFLLLAISYQNWTEGLRLLAIDVYEAGSVAYKALGRPEEVIEANAETNVLDYLGDAVMSATPKV